MLSKRMPFYAGRLPILVALGLLVHAHAQTPPASPQSLFGTCLARIASLIEPAPDQEPRTVLGALRIREAAGMAEELAGRSADWAFQAPDRFRLSFRVGKESFALGRHGSELWILAPEKRFGVVGSPEVPRFLGKPDTLEETSLPPIRLPIPRAQLLLLPMAFEVGALPDATIDGTRCRVLEVKPRPQARQMFGLPAGTATLWVRPEDSLPVQIAVADDRGRRLVLGIEHLRIEPAHPDSAWDVPAATGPEVRKVALAHLTRFVPAALSILQIDLPPLPPPDGERRVVAGAGAGRLEEIDGTRVLFLKGSPEEMGRQHGELLRKGVHDLVAKVVYGIGVGSSFEKGRWFFGEIEECQARIEPFIDERYLREMDALAAAVDLHPQEIRLANFFPELFHCSGFAVWGQATADGRLYHGRVLDYMKGVGLEPNAVVIIHQPDEGHAWANVSYAGFVGSVTAMNEKRISLGEMGGRGEGNWDGKPMAQLVREVMEHASTLDEGLEIMRKGPRTCEYFYVLADGNSRRAVGIAATPDSFEIVEAGMAHPRLPHAVPDAVLLSAGDRYEQLVARVVRGYGRLDATGARALMDRPVAMKSNIHSVLFAPETLDFWVANADSVDIAAHARYTHYNLGDLLGRTAGTPLAQHGE
ncbi:MAG: hypothetical protein H7A45_04745 [Verrucomicrobiales bacterium]|nr:hypothetical protein [Verrucomicrobiales bacterium]